MPPTCGKQSTNLEVKCQSWFNNYVLEPVAMQRTWSTASYSCKSKARMMIWVRMGFISTLKYTKLGGLSRSL